MERLDHHGNEVDELATALSLLRVVQHDVSSMVDGAITDAPPTPDQVRTYFLALAVEVFELMNEFPAWKPWKQPKEVNKDKLIDEFADILAFIGVILNYIHELGITAVELAQGYVKKTNTNVSRFNGNVDGYRVRQTRND